jgi:hypothetical protein
MDDNKLTDPYGSLEYAVGSGDDFVCFDFWVDRANKRVLLHAVLNSETGHFIQDFEKPEWVPIDKAHEGAVRLVHGAMDWAGENDVPHDTEGWRQDPMYFARAVKARIEKHSLVERRL